MLTGLTHCQGLTAKEVCDFFFKEDTRLEWEGECALPPLPCRITTVLQLFQGFWSQ